MSAFRCSVALFICILFLPQLVMHRVVTLTEFLSQSSADKFQSLLSVNMEYAVAQLVEVLRYKPEGRGFDSH